MIMIGASTPLDTFTLELPKNDTAFFKTIAKKMGWTVRRNCGNPLPTLNESSMPCFFSEEELDKEIHLSIRSGNATQEEVDAVFNR